MKESKDIQQIRDWLELQEVDGYSTSHKSAIIRSCEPFGLFQDYKAEDGTTYEYFNGKLTTVTRGKTQIRLDNSNIY